MPSEPKAVSKSSIKRQRILNSAEQLFAKYGFEGVSLDSIAQAVDTSRHNLLYYFPNKEQLYIAVLDDVLEPWMQSSGLLSQTDVDAHKETDCTRAAVIAALQRYIADKIKFSRERPSGSMVFTQEVMTGAPRYAHTLRTRALPLLLRDIQAFEAWAEAGLIPRLDFMHLMFNIWAMTQAYADHAPQYALLMGKSALAPQDFDQAQTLIEHMVLSSLGLSA